MKEKIIQLIVNYKLKVETYLNDGKYKDPLRRDLIKQLKISNLALTIIQFDDKIEDFEIQYFIGQVFVGRYFSDFGLDWIANNYYEISHYILKYHCDQEKITDKSIQSSIKEYIPFKIFPDSSF